MRQLAEVAEIFGNYAKSAHQRRTSCKQRAPHPVTSDRRPEWLSGMQDPSMISCAGNQWGAHRAVSVQSQPRSAAWFFAISSTAHGCLLACGGRRGRTRYTPPRVDRGARWRDCAQRTCSGRALALPVMLHHVPTRGEAHGDGETALLRLVEALVQRLLGVGQTP
jgi:hypothetical protein